MRIFLSYGHDANEELVRRIKADLEARGHDVWFDKSDIRFGDDWRRAITDGIVGSNRVLSFLSKYSTRDPGVCLDELAIAIGVKGGNIQTILVESETEVKPPPSIGHIQWLDMHDWKERRAANEAEWEEWYHSKLTEIVRVIESDESRRFAGEIETLNGYLKPISSDSRVSTLLRKGFVGRDWLFDAIEQWRTAADRASRLFWIVGEPGVGKSAFAAHLTHFGRDKVIAAQFVEWDKPDHRSAQRVIRSITFQLATRLPEYRKLLLTLPEIKELDQKDPAELFDYLLANPLRTTIAGGRERHLIVIDGLDEAGEADHNPLVEMLSRNAQRLPDWIGLVLTSRPESAVKTPLQGLNPSVLDTRTEANRNDICDYLRHELTLQLESRPDADRLVMQILEKSEGLFLYVERFCDDLQRGHLSLDRPEQFPQGLGGVFCQFFDRQFPDIEKFRKSTRPALRAILAAREPLPVEILQRIFNWQDEELQDFTRPLGSLFPVAREASGEVIKPYHKSLADWLADQGKSGTFFVSQGEGHTCLANHGWNVFNTHSARLPLYFIKNLPSHLALCQSITKESLFGLARSDVFLSMQKVGVPEDPDLPYRTLRLALDAACRIENVPAMAEFTLAHARGLAVARTETPLKALLNETLPERSRLERSWKLADMLGGARRNYALLLLAWKLQQLNKLEDATTTLSRISMADDSSLGVPGVAVPLIACIQPVEGIKLDELAALLLGTENDLYRLVTLQSDARRFPLALATAAQLKSPFYLAIALIAIGRSQASAKTDAKNTFESARDAAARIDDSLRNSTLEEVAEAQARSGLVVEGIRTAEMIDGWRERAFGSIALAQAQHGEIAEAYKIAERTGSYWIRVETLLGIAEAERQMNGDPTRACEMAAEYARSINRDSTHRNPLPLLKVIIAFARFGDFVSAKALADEIGDPVVRTEAVTAIATAKARSDGDAEALYAEAEVCAAKADRRNIPMALAGVAAAPARTGQNPASTFASARAAAKGIYELGYRVGALADLATAEASVGQFDAAVEIAKDLSKDSKHGFEKALQEIVYFQAKAGQIDAALRTNRLLEDDFQYRWALNYKVIPGLCESQLFSEAITITGGMPSSDDRAKAFEDISVAQAEAGDFDAAALTLCRIEAGANYLHTRAIEKIATCEMKAGRDPTDTLALVLEQSSPHADLARYCRGLASIITLARRNRQIPEGFLPQATRNCDGILPRERTQVVQTITGALQAIDGIGESSASVPILNATAYGTELKRARDIADAKMRIEALCAMAVSYALAGVEPQSALELARSALPIPYGPPLLMDDIKDIRDSLSGKIDETEHMVNLIHNAIATHSNTQGAVIGGEGAEDKFIAVADGLMRTGGFDCAINAAGRIKNEKARQAMYREIAEAEASAGRDDAPTLAAAIAIGNRSSLPAYLLQASFNQASAYTACNVLVHLFPFSAPDVLEAFIASRHSRPQW
jgi:hypothetical protein